MKIFTTKTGLESYLSEARYHQKLISLVPTMGALHEGHLALLGEAKRQSDIAVCSIFVNPTQFNDKSDLERYPRPIERDIELLKSIGCDVLFHPAVNEMYAPNETWHLDIGYLETILEGKFRPGHYQGVTQIVNKLFRAVQPHQALFGQKDYQQVLVIKKMVKLLQMPVEIMMCPIVREESGLALSSRNVHLNAEEKEIALSLSRTLNLVKEQFKMDDLAALQQMGADLLNKQHGLNLVYFEILDGENLLPVSEITQSIVALVAAFVGQTRLIDNIVIV